MLRILPCGLTGGGRLAASRFSRKPLSRNLAVKVLTDEGMWPTVTSGEGLSVVYFTATWCGPCKMISPIYEALSKDYTAATFLKVDVDDQPDVAAMANVTAMPTFQFYKAGQKVDQIVGADADKLKTYLKSHSAA